MTLSLILTRHAKSAWNDPAQDDFDRPLNGRGRNSAIALGNWLVANGHLPDDVVVSGARRTVETWSRMAPAMPATAAMQSNPALYLASADTMLGVLKAQSARTVMMIGHNPGIAQLARQLAKIPPNDHRFGSYPAGATTIYDFDADAWSEIASGTAKAFVAVRDLL